MRGGTSVQSHRAVCRVVSAALWIGLWHAASMQARYWAGGVCVQVTAVWRVLHVL